MFKIVTVAKGASIDVEDRPEENDDEYKRERILLLRVSTLQVNVRILTNKNLSKGPKEKG